MQYRLIEISLVTQKFNVLDVEVLLIITKLNNEYRYVLPVHIRSGKREKSDKYTNLAFVTFLEFKTLYKKYYLNTLKIVFAF